MINLKIKTNGTVRNLTLPYPGQSIPDIIEKNSVVTISEVTEPESLKYMEGHEWNIDEINFLAKRMESFDKREKRQFDAIASQLKADAEDLNGSFGDRYESEIVNCFIKYTELDSCDMIEYFDQSESARAKIMSAKWGFDNIDGTLFGVVTAKLKEPLTGDEEEVFKAWILGQNSDGLGEGFEQQDIEIDDGILNVHFWNSSDEYYVENEDDFYNRMDNGMGGMM